MNLRRSRRHDPDVNLTPLIDVVFLLLIFFMVASTFRKEGELDINLPQASNTPVPQPVESVVVAIDAQGDFAVGDEALGQAEGEILKSALEAALNGDRSRPFIIRADGRTPHEAVVRVMDLAGQLGIRRLSIATEPEVQAEP